MGYTATQTGFATAATGVLAVLAAPLSANLSASVDARLLVFLGDQLVQGQAVMLATNQVFLWAGLAFIQAAVAIWFAPKPTRVADTTGAH